jgi:hypothetical protein
VIECLSSKHVAMSSNPNIKKNPTFFSQGALSTQIYMFLSTKTLSEENMYIIVIIILILLRSTCHKHLLSCKPHKLEND